jgi:hypothetical protein
MKTEEEIRLIFNESTSKSDVCRKLKLPLNKRGFNKVDGYIETLKVDTSHFDKGVSKRIRYEQIEKCCPVCGEKFMTQKNHQREKITCSRSCSNTFFRSGRNNGNWSGNSYRTACFMVHEKKCIVCGEEKIVSVHHYDENRDNNDPYNLVPLCPTHHQYVHSRYKHLVIDIIDEYRKKFAPEAKAASRT